MRHLRLAVGLALFGAVVWWSIRNLPPVDFSPLWLIFSGALLCFTILLNVAEVALVGRLVGVDVTPSTAVHTAVRGSILNLLPVPGAALLRQTVLTRLGASHREVAIAQARVAGTAILAALVVASGGAALAGWKVALPAGGAAFLLTVAIARSLSLILLEITFAVVSSIRLFVMFAALGHFVAFHDVLVLAAGGPLASAIGVIPGGIGMREVFVAAIAGATVIPSALAGLVASADRAVGILVLALVNLTLTILPTLQGGRRQKTVPE